MTLSKADIGTLSLCCRTPAFLRFLQNTGEQKGMSAKTANL